MRIRTKTTKRKTSAPRTSARRNDPALASAEPQPGFRLDINADDLALARFAHAELVRRAHLSADKSLSEWMVDAIFERATLAVNRVIFGQKDRFIFDPRSSNREHLVP